MRESGMCRGGGLSRCLIGGCTIHRVSNSSKDKRLSALQQIAGLGRSSGQQQRRETPGEGRKDHPPHRLDPAAATSGHRQTAGATAGGRAEGGRAGQGWGSRLWKEGCRRISGRQDEGSRPR